MTTFKYLNLLKEIIHAPTKVVPQGSVMSPVLLLISINDSY